MSTTKTATLYLIPVPIADGALYTLSPEIITHTAHITHYFVENLRSARRFLKSIHPALIIDDLQCSEIDKHEGADIPLLKKWLKEGKEIGLLSEAGCPCIADPGAALVRVAQETEAKVKPITGPDAIILALMASGLNGQNFSFIGYVPVKDPLRSKAIKDLEARSIKEGQTQIFIETPYRNNAILADLLLHCNGNTLICIAYNITAADEWIRTKTAAEWKKDIPKLDKSPAVFLLAGK